MALVVLVAIFAGYSLRHDPRVIPMALVGKPLPDLVLPPLDGGEPHRLRTIAKGPVLVNFFASWCVPCASEAPALAALKDEGVQVIGIDYKDKPADAHAFLTRYGDPYAAVLTDPDGRAGIEFGITGVPETYAVDRAQVVRAKKADPIVGEDAETLVERSGG